MDEISVLVVDDDKVVLSNLEKVLRLKGYRVDTARTGSEAIKKSEAGFYNIALLDIKLPDMEGVELLEKLVETLPRTVKIMVTGYPGLENAVNSLNMGADAYLIKPVSPQNLLKIVKEKLAEQEGSGKMTEEKLKLWIETRVRKLRMANHDAKV